jgi:hypothetical protein
MPNNAETIKDLTLMLLYLTSWKNMAGSSKKDRATIPLQSWKGYDFVALDALRAEELIFGTNKAKAVYFTGEGIARAKELLAQYDINE